MLEIVLHFDPDMKLSEVREFVELCRDKDGDYPIAAYDENGDARGLSVVVDSLG